VRAQCLCLWNSQGGTRFVAIDKFHEIRDCGGLLTADGSDCYRERWASPEDCGSEPSVESVTYGTSFIGLVVPTRAIAPRESLKETLTKDGQVIAFRSLEGADVYYNEPKTCFVDVGIATATGALGGGFEFQRWPKGPLPVGRYHFGLTSGAEVLSAGDLTVAAA